MTAYHLCIQSDGRIVLDREVCGELLQTIEVADPPLKWRWIDDKWQQVPEYRHSYAVARAQVKEADLRYERGEGWFRKVA